MAMTHAVSPLDRAEKALDILMDSAERLFDLSETSVLSDFQGRRVIDVRRMMCRILRDDIGASFHMMGDLFKRDHSTIFFCLRKHDELVEHDQKYSAEFRLFKNDVRDKMNAMNYRPIKNGVLKLKEIHSSEKDVFDISMSCFAAELEATEFVKANGIPPEFVVFRGDVDKVSEGIAQEIVLSDEKKYMEAVMRKSMDLLRTIIDEPVLREYMDYSTGECTIVDDPVRSYKTAAALFGTKRIAIIYMARQKG